MNRLILLAAALALAPAAVLAQDSNAAAATDAAPAAVPPPTVAPSETIAPPTCTRPTIERDPKTSKIVHIKELNKSSDAFQACTDAYIELQKANAKAHYDAADEANRQRNEFARQMNAAAAEVEAKIKAQQEKEKKEKEENQ